MTAPITPTACNKTPVSQFSHHGINIPFMTSACGGADTMYWKKINQSPSGLFIIFIHRVVKSYRLSYLVAERYRHDGDEEAEEQLQFPQTVLVQEQKGKRVDDGDKNSSPYRKPANKTIKRR